MLLLRRIDLKLENARYLGVIGSTDICMYVYVYTYSYVLHSYCI